MMTGGYPYFRKTPYDDMNGDIDMFGDIYTGGSLMIIILWMEDILHHQTDGEKPKPSITWYPRWGFP